MNRRAYLLLLPLSITAAFLAGTWYSQRPAAANTSTGGRKILYYTDPMHPAYKSDKPGIAPDCGMQLEPVYADAAPAEDNGSSCPNPGAVKIRAGKQQLSGVRVSEVRKASASQTLRLFGRVAPEEHRVYRINAGIEGFIKDVSAPTTGSLVKKDQLLATFSAPMATMTIQTYILNLGAEDSLKEKSAKGSREAQALPAAIANIQQRRQSMQNLGMSLVQMEEIKHSREVPEFIKILAPADGFVLARNVSPGLKFERGAEWYRIADLSKVWVLADVFENDARYVRPGVRAEVIVRGQSKTLVARVSEVLPQFDPAARTLKVRLKVDNPGFILRPDMFVDVELPVSLTAAVAVPVDAVLDSGLKKTVFVERGEGQFEPREVATGWRFGDRVEIVKGLEPGERIVVSGNFLLDSESRMRHAAAGAQPKAAVKDPVCGMEVDPAKAAATEYKGHSYHFCSKSCKEKFDKNPEQYGQRISEPRT